jgi:hypothetical protein
LEAIPDLIRPGVHDKLIVRKRARNLAQEDGLKVAIRSAEIVHEMIDGEVVIVNFTSGRYYSLENTGGEVWQFIGEGLPVEVIADRLANRYEGDKAEIKQAVESFVNVLMNEGIVQRTSEDNGTGAQAVAESTSDRPSTPVAKKFELPTVTFYNDMEGLLLLDPAFGARAK